jgi:signal transduction histidine kinase/phage shock protein PspC (stress-responsive transcriptional regulator)
MELGSYRRATEGRVLGGVAAGLARATGLRPNLVRFLSVVFANVAIPVYVLAWALLRDDQGGPGLLAKWQREEQSRFRRVVGLVIIVVGVVILLDGIGVWLPGAGAWPLVLVAIGLTIAWHRTPAPAEGTQRPSGSMREGLQRAQNAGDVWRVVTSHWDASRRAQRIRFLVGGALVLSALSAMFASGRGFSGVKDSLLGAVYLTGGVALMFGPSLLRLVDELNAERRARATADARAEVATHLHDSVLQTLAIIQRRADNPREVVTLARRQERELRAWLYGGTEVRTADSAATIGEAIEVVADEALNDSLRALTSAAREATVNAAKHAGVDDVSVYVECVSSGDAYDVEVFVRDRGKGFDVETVEGDRRGLRDSIEARMERAGGTATITSAPGEGTEVQLRIRTAPVVAPSPPDGPPGTGTTGTGTTGTGAGGATRAEDRWVNGAAGGPVPCASGAHRPPTTHRGTPPTTPPGPREER